ncbi:DUF4244 domain-containing protein [Streptomyces lunaelactis]|nr:DUF4244 domain-containing protein [Streptomyces lunaelactis]NUK00802.1 DUF4244 domain-containing protein [Streptomyces lunaelactis]NUK10809.1 DUF4244 domain-containing protein [Streptomyces lunaelactis]NUK20982.1 DUF4244 domain-containing protein [Streptomyces lunaelactis]NUK37211.1 DUF4244 domain-containing protein [Streptomyces lunaelactis]NUK40908.1 DUF4244 domain-containing protein [Streptomyces lunaelactis]
MGVDMWNPVRGWLRGLARRMRGDAGMTTSEYAMGTIAACAFAAVLYKVVTSGAVSGALQSVIGKALNAQF